ncbi:hypothetical protein [Xanthomonas sp. NCPPB 2632]|uniref:hypothetical protein n=1 Tax=Xanthomonas sp. NCPPB 2632 TaxID=3240912 RepID=UPI0035180CB0
MSTPIFISIWALGAIATLVVSVNIIRLITRLKERYPALYERVGKPSLITQGTAFLWRLKHHRSELAPRDSSFLSRILVQVYVAYGLLVAMAISVAMTTF